MISINEAFRKFRSRLELTRREQEDASKRQQEIRSILGENFKRERDFLTGSYKRWTKTKPLKDVDIFFVLHDDERHYRDNKPSKVLSAFGDVLAKEYGSDRVRSQRRSVCVTFDVQDDYDRVLSFDVVPAFTKDGHYEIPDAHVLLGWIETDPEVHEQLAKEAQDAFNQEWKGLVRMVKKWNEERGKPVRPSFLLEVMALQLLVSPFNGDYAYELKAFFASAAEDIYEAWADPAGLGPSVSDGMNTAEKRSAERELREAERDARNAIDLARAGKTGDALRVWRERVFGPMFPLS
ncbi:MAG: CBASS oligonucleotide cyclase [Candidatus Binatia bacterium]